MNKEKSDKIDFIDELLKKNLTDVSIEKPNARESEKYTFSLSINNMCISLIIEDRFLDKSSEEIIDYFQKNSVDQKIRSCESKICRIGEDMVLWPDDPDCQRLKK
ncbi:MAG: hypothetical protein D3919_12570 [Candidatus Electrothrix sp. AW5]|nr:hypothetical protein [Candidatus Electrothrix gigas]